MTQQLFNRYREIPADEVQAVRRSVLDRIIGLHQLAADWQNGGQAHLVDGELFGAGFYRQMVAEQIASQAPGINEDLERIRGISTELVDRRTGIAEQIQLVRWTGLSISAGEPHTHAWQRHDIATNTLVPLELPAAFTHKLLEQ